MDVFVTTLNQSGVIVSNVTKSNDVQVQIGNLKTSVNINCLRKINKSINESKLKKNISSFNNISKAKTVKPEINVIGYTVDEAIFVVDKFLDDCYLAKLEIARIVHGKGTGKLRSGIHQFLKTNPHVKSFRNGTFGEGEMGVTIVELK